ncbi:MAG TPA: hypothetical protein V6C90_24155 [Coleofasciculaceae cyanobacterium]|jgi:hypothetical protein
MQIFLDIIDMIIERHFSLDSAIPALSALANFQEDGSLVGQLPLVAQVLSPEDLY